VNEYINEYLDNYIKKDKYPWHMPGHKRRQLWQENELSGKMLNLAAELDFTEALGLDDLHAPEDFIKESQEAFAGIYKTQGTFMLTGGSTVGILSAVFACTGQGDTVIMARNCHKAVYNAVRLRQLKPYYLYPDIIEETGIFGGISEEELKQLLEKLTAAGENPAAVIITSPTYEGIISDISAISHLLKEKEIPLIVDEAHGAHLEYMENMATAMSCQADIVIESLHKTLPALTQTALLHVCNKRFLPKVKEYIDIFLTSSPSYIFMQSMEKAVIYSHTHRESYIEYEKRVRSFREKCKELSYIKLFAPEADMSYNVHSYDIGKLVFVVSPDLYINDRGKLKQINGTLCLKILEEEYGQVMEMAAGNYFLAMTSIADAPEAFDMLYEALNNLEQRLIRGESRRSYKKRTEKYGFGRMKLLPYQVEDMVIQDILLTEAEGKIAGAYVYAYPPGVPILVPGEEIDRESISRLAEMKALGLKLAGIKDTEAGIVIPVAEKEIERDR
jgi:arginine/lysine/ornithine decarboxylase